MSTVASTSQGLDRLGRNVSTAAVGLETASDCGPSDHEVAVDSARREAARDLPARGAQFAVPPSLMFQSPALEC